MARKFRVTEHFWYPHNIWCRETKRRLIIDCVNIVEWTLGAVLYEDELTAIKDCEAPESPTNSATGTAFHSAACCATSLVFLLFISERLEHLIGHYSGVASNVN